MEINIDNWHEFEISELFNIKRLVRVSGDNGEYIKDHEIIDSNGTCPYIAAVSVNNGIKGYSNREPNNKGNCITFSTTTESATTVFYQPVDFVGRQQMVGIYGNSENEMSKERAFFLIPIIKNNLLHFNYDNKLTYDDVLELSIKLPAIYSAEKEEYEPDWDYIEEFIKELKEENEKKLSSLKTLLYPNNTLVNGGYNLDISDWHEFNLTKLFDIKQSKGDIQFQKTTGGSIPLVSSGNDETNSIVGYISEGDGAAEKFNAGDITIDMFGCANYQTKDFYAVSHGRVTILEPLYKKNKFISLFIVTCLNKKFKALCSYSNMCSMRLLQKENILLPAIYNDKKEKYEPDWEYMENFTINLQESVKDQLRRLKQKDE